MKKKEDNHRRIRARRMEGEGMEAWGGCKKKKKKQNTFAFGRRDVHQSVKSPELLSRNVANPRLKSVCVCDSLSPPHSIYSLLFHNPFFTISCLSVCRLSHHTLQSMQCECVADRQ